MLRKDWNKGLENKNGCFKGDWTFDFPVAFKFKLFQDTDIL